MSKGSRTDLCGGWPERAIPTATGRGQSGAVHFFASKGDAAKDPCSRIR